MSEQDTPGEGPPPEPTQSTPDDNQEAKPDEESSPVAESGNVIATEDSTEDKPKDNDEKVAPEEKESTEPDQQEKETTGDNRSGETTTENADGDATTGAATSEASEGAPQAADPDGIGNSKGAQILMSRFSSWKQTANQGAQTMWKKSVIPENAKSLWKQTPNLAAMPRLQKVVGGGGAAAEKAEPVSDNFVLSPDAQTASKQTSSLADKTDSDEAGDEAPKNENAKDDTPGETPAEETDANKNDEQVDSRVRVGAALSKASTAASVVAESVATGFRGRYSGRADPQTSPMKGAETTRKATQESQTDLILKSRVGKYMQEILDSLEDHEFAMLLGSGMLGVNLKQCFLKNHGVFVDFLVPGGQAESSGIVRSGDLLVRLGDADLRKGTILEIPKAISKARRPVVLILSTGTKLAVEKINYIDVAIAMMHRARDYYNKRGSLSNLPSASPVKGETGEESPVVDEIRSICDIEVPEDNSADSFVTPPAPTLEIRKDFVDEVALRSFDKFIVSGLCEVGSLDSNFRIAVRNAFLTCAIDSRRLPFLVRHLSAEEELPEGSNEGNMVPSAQLMLFLELMSFLDLYSVTPFLKLKEKASRLAYKFFLPTQIGSNLQPPLFDFHSIVPDSSLRHLEFVLSAKKSNTIPRDIFLDFQKAVADSLSAGPFISFLASAECSRMRAYLRNTAPYAPVPLRALFDSVVGDDKYAAATKNSFAYILLFSICQVEKEPNGEHNFATEEENGRVVGAPDGLCCAIYIKRTLVPAINEAKAKIETLKPEEELDPSIAQKVLSSCEVFWDTYVNGSLSILSKRNEIESCCNQVRSELENVANDILKAGSPEPNRKNVEIVVKSNLTKYGENLAAELLYNYGANVHTKFREHKFHEWMCTELSKVRAVDPNYTNKQDLPILPQGCVKRLLRKVELPDGVSSHKPFKKSSKEAGVERNYPNAELAVVFGSSFGTDLATEMPIPGMEGSDIRRYACLPVALDREGESLSGESLPPTFESYAVVPPMKKKPFGEIVDSARTSADGWEVSLVSFTIPNAESSDPSADSALFGVSLFFQRKSSATSASRDIKTVFSNQESANASESGAHEDGKKGLVSPLTFDTVTAPDGESTDESDNKKETIRKVKVTSDFSEFNKEMEKGLWVDHASQDEYRDQSKPISIGLALVSRRNVIIAMRDALNMLLHDYSRLPGGNTPSNLSTNCSAIVNILGTFANKDIEGGAMKHILEPYLRAASSQWVDRPVVEQTQAFETMALQQLSDCLPPTPLALMFVTVLLEQKVVLSSSRRSVLHSATVGLASLLHPLRWSHLLVPLVPGALAGDLIQYPAPFVLGIPSEEDVNRELLGNLPKDVTLIDLDVGRVILAPSFGQDNEMVRRSANSEATGSALRAQVLYLAQAIGGVFGNSLRPKSWGCDSPVRPEGAEETQSSGVGALRTVARNFVGELLEGVTSCCYWVEEVAQSYGTSVEPTVLFDEDKFFEMKNQRAKRTNKPLFQTERSDELALNLDDFDLVLESFLRCQSVSTYISSRPKTDMLYY